MEKLLGWSPSGFSVCATELIMPDEKQRLERLARYLTRAPLRLDAVVDMDSLKVLELSDTGVSPIAKAGQDFDMASLRPARARLKSLVVSQPEGVNFDVRGHEVRWQGWSFRYAFHPREGLVLYTVGYGDHGKTRPILYRAALSEMIVRYGDPDPNWSWRAAFDVGEYGFGKLSSPLDKGLDVPPTAQLYDATFADSAGKPYVLPRAVALYERDGGVLWKHYDFLTGINAIRRARQLVMTFSAAIGNYDYIVSWIFHQDGTLALDAALTGILLGKGTEQKKSSTLTCPGCSSHLVAENVLAPNHQHFFNFRLDFDVDGPANAVSEMNTRALPAGAANAGGYAFIMEETPLANEREAQRDLSSATHRVWRVANNAVRNHLEQTSGYALVPGDGAISYALPDGPTRKRATFVDHQIWATRYRETERYAAGDYPNQSPADSGLSAWTNDDEPLAGEDVVLWYTMGVTHVPRTEEWPIMNAHHLGFKLVPAGFFDRNPALDVPR